MTKLDHALALAAEGFWVFPLQVDGKKPPKDMHFKEMATRNEAVIRAWWSSAAAFGAYGTDCNIGIYTGKFGDDEALLVIDVDNKSGKRGDDEILRLELQGLDFPETKETLTPTGGRHIFLRVPSAVRQGANVLGLGLDTRSRGGYCVGPGSTIGAAGYTVCRDQPVAPAPAWVLDKIGTSTRRRDKHQPSSDAAAAVPSERAFARAVRYLREEADVGVAGALSDTSYKVACRVKDMGVDEATCVDLMLEHWRHSPAMDRDDMATRVGNAYRYGIDPPGAAAPEADFEPVAPEPEEPEALSPHAELNKEFAFVVAGGGSHILWETHDVHGRPKLEHLATAAFHAKFAARKITYGKRVVPLTQDWMEWAGRRSYDGIVFVPGQPVPERFYNVWTGFSVAPLPADETPSAEAQAALDAFLDHARANVCKGNEALYRYLIGYFAHLVQRPWEKPLVSLVFRGGKGVGKNALVERVGDLLGPHFLVTSNRRYLIGNFNGHLENCLLFALDEAFWSGDKQAEGIVKDLITGKSHVVEHKGKEPYTVDNRTRVVIIGNESWLVPASHDERRFAVYDVGDGRKQDLAFFQTMREGMARGGSRLLLRFLQGVDLTGFDLNAAPSTAALLDQKHESLEPLQQWWLACLDAGRILLSDFGEGWPGEVERERLRGAFQRYARERNVRSRLPDDRDFGRKLRDVCPGLADKRQRAGAYCYVLPALEAARGMWDRWIGHEVEWPAL